MVTKFEKELHKHKSRMQDPDTASHVWTHLLTQAERQRLRSLEEEYQEGRTIGIWMRAKNVSHELAIIQLARAHGLPLIDYSWLLSMIDQEEPVTELVSGRPHWDLERGKLFFEGKVIRRVLRIRQATGIVAILNEFQELGWPESIDDPLPGERDPNRLGQTLRRLRDGLTKINFRRNGSGDGVIWNTND